MHLVNHGAQKYTEEFGSPGDRIFSKPTRMAVAREYTRRFLGEHSAGEFESTLPKKYQKPGSRKSPDTVKIENFLKGRK